MKLKGGGGTLTSNKYLVEGNGPIDGEKTHSKHIVWPYSDAVHWYAKGHGQSPRVLYILSACVRVFVCVCVLQIAQYSTYSITKKMKKKGSKTQNRFCFLYYPFCSSQCSSSFLLFSHSFISPKGVIGWGHSVSRAWGSRLYSLSETLLGAKNRENVTDKKI